MLYIIKKYNFYIYIKFFLYSLKVSTFIKDYKRFTLAL
jgi:hypothetical protein